MTRDYHRQHSINERPGKTRNVQIGRESKCALALPNLALAGKRNPAISGGSFSTNGEEFTIDAQTDFLGAASGDKHLHDHAPAMSKDIGAKFPRNGRKGFR